MTQFGFFGNGIQIDAANTRIGPGKVFVDNLLVNTKCFKNLGATVRFDGGDAILDITLTMPLTTALL